MVVRAPKASYGSAVTHFQFPTSNTLEMKSKKKPFLVETMLLGSSIKNLKRFGSGQREEQYYALLSAEFDVSLFEYTSAPENVNFKSIPVLFKNKWLHSILTPILQRKKVSGLGVVRSKQLWGAWSAWLFARLMGKKFILRCGYIWSRAVTHEHPNLDKGLRHAVFYLEKFLIRRADALIYASDDIAVHYKQFLRSRPYVVIPNGFDISIFKPMHHIRKSYDFIYVGRLIPLKGIERMLSYIGENKSLIVAGSGPLENLVKERENTTYIGVVQNSELPFVLNQARYFISMSTTEGNPKCLIEAILCGLFPVVSDIPAHRSLINELGYGVLIKQGMHRDFADDECAIVVDKLDEFRNKYSISAIVAREIDFCVSFVQ